MFMGGRGREEIIRCQRFPHRFSLHSFKGPWGLFYHRESQSFVSQVIAQPPRVEFVGQRKQALRSEGQQRLFLCSGTLGVAAASGRENGTVTTGSSGDICTGQKPGQRKGF